MGSKISCLGFRLRERQKEEGITVYESQWSHTNSSQGLYFYVHAKKMWENLVDRRHYSHIKLQYKHDNSINIDVYTSNKKHFMESLNDKNTKKQDLVEILRDKIAKKIGIKVTIDIKFIKYVDNIQLFATEISDSLKKSKMPIRIIKKYLNTCDNLSVSITGRICGAVMTKRVNFKKGRISRQRKDAEIYEYYTQIDTSSGSCGLKIIKAPSERKEFDDKKDFGDKKRFNHHRKERSYYAKEEV